MCSVYLFNKFYFSIAVCLSTVDRRSRERFIESNNQIASLVEKFKLEGGAYRKYVGSPTADETVETHQKIPLTAYGRPGSFSVLLTLIRYVIVGCVILYTGVPKVIRCMLHCAC